MSGVPPVITTIAIGGLAALDATPVAQTLASQPLVTATLLGWVWGEWEIALQIGVVLQLLAASTLPVGSRTPEDYALGGVAGVGTALALAANEPLSLGRDACALLGVLFGIVVATAGVPLLKWQRRLHEGLSRWCEQRLRAGDEAALGHAHRAAVVLAFGVGVGYCALALAVGLLALPHLVHNESLRLAHAWNAAQPLWIGFGLAQLLTAFVQRRLARAALFGVALVASWLVLMVGHR